MQHVEALILDWAGTAVDYGSIAPTSIFVEAFAKAYDFKISLAEARGPMGMGKWDHIKTLGQMPEVDRRWREQFGKSMDDATVDHIYETFMPLQKTKVADRSMPLTGVVNLIDKLRASGIKIGSCSGYPREVMKVLAKATGEHGYQPDCIVCSDDLAAGSRPGPWMALQNVIEMGIKDVAHCIKFDDSAPGISEGLRAGMWTVGISLTGNAIGLSEEEWQQCSPSEQAVLEEQANAELGNAGAHYIVRSLAEALPIIQSINARIARGERP